METSTIPLQPRARRGVPVSQSLAFFFAHGVCHGSDASEHGCESDRDDETGEEEPFSDMLLASEIDVETERDSVEGQSQDERDEDEYEVVAVVDSLDLLFVASV